MGSVEETSTGSQLLINASRWDHRPRPGDSVAVNGCCLTVAGTDDGVLAFDVVPQTLRLTALGRLRQGDPVNLEHAATPQTLLGGHLMQGHVDGIATVMEVISGDAEYRLRVRPPAHLMPLIVDKGSVALDGVSLTIAEVGSTWFEIALIPTTLQRTTLGRADVGTQLNIEADCLARMVGRWLEAREPGGRKSNEGLPDAPQTPLV